MRHGKSAKERSKGNKLPWQTAGAVSILKCGSGQKDWATSAVETNLIFYFLFLFILLFFASGRHKQNNKPQAWGWHLSLSHLPPILPCAFLSLFHRSTRVGKIVETFDNYIWRLLLWQLSQVRKKVEAAVSLENPITQGIRSLSNMVLHFKKLLRWQSETKKYLFQILQCDWGFPCIKHNVQSGRLLFVWLTKHWRVLDYPLFT